MELNNNFKDILVEIPDEELPELSKMYETQQDWAPFVYSMINTGIKWRNKNKKIVTFMSPNGCWRKDGTFLAVMNYGWHHIFIFTLDETGKNAIDGVLQTKKLSCPKPQPMHTAFFNVHSNLYPQLIGTLEEKRYKIMFGNDEDACHIMYSMKKEDALKISINCPSDVYIESLKASMVDTIKQYYHNKYPEPETFLETLIKMDRCFGVFLKSNNELVSWVLRSCLGQLAILQTADKHLRKGYGSLIIKHTIVEIATDGFNPYGAVGITNKASQIVFEKLGFQNLGVCKFFGVRL